MTLLIYYEPNKKLKIKALLLKLKFFTFSDLLGVKNTFRQRGSKFIFKNEIFWWEALEMSNKSVCLRSFEVTGGQNFGKWLITGKNLNHVMTLNKIRKS